MRLSTAADAVAGQSPPTTTLYRIVRADHVNLFPPPNFRGRFDDPRGEYRVLYASLERTGSFAETLQQFRPDLATRAAMARLSGSAVPRPEVRLTSWAHARVLLTLRLARTARLCDLRNSTNLEHAANGVAGDAAGLGIDDLDASHVTGSDRRVTQRVSRWAYDTGYDGLLYPSRLATAWTCCALFNRIRPRVVNREPVAVADPDLLEVSRAFNIRVTSADDR